MNLSFIINDTHLGEVAVHCNLPDHVYAMTQAGRIAGDTVVLKDTSTTLNQCKLIINGRCKHIIYFHAAGIHLFGLTNQCTKKLAEILKVSAQVQEIPDEYGNGGNYSTRTRSYSYS